MNYKERKAFRASHVWKKFKAKCRLHTSIDYITKEPLVRNWNLHHLDLSTARYDKLDDMKRFLPLNPKTHETLHALYELYKKNQNVVARMQFVMEQMLAYSGNSTPDQLYVHKKTGNIYLKLDTVIECTNGREELTYIIYQNQDGMKFCREATEFNNKFIKY